VGSLAVPFRGGPTDIEGVLPTTIDLDRMASRALDAPVYEITEKTGLIGRSPAHA